MATMRRKHAWAARTVMSRTGVVLWHVNGCWVPELSKGGIFADHDSARNAIAIGDPSTPEPFLIVKIVRGTPPDRWMELPGDELSQQAARERTGPSLPLKSDC